MREATRAFLSGLGIRRVSIPSWLGPAAIVVILVYLVIPPFFFLAQTSFLSGDMITGEGRLSLEHYSAILSSASTLDLLWNSLVFAIGSSVVGLLVGGTLAWIVERTNTPFR